LLLLVEWIAYVLSASCTGIPANSIQAGVRITADDQGLAAKDNAPLFTLVLLNGCS
jgi:hypothetical protein